MTKPEPETRYYIGITPMGRLGLKGTGTFTIPPGEPMELGPGTMLFPVSQQIYWEWIGPEDEDDYEITCGEDGPGPDAMRWVPGSGSARATAAGVQDC